MTNVNLCPVLPRSVLIYAYYLSIIINIHLPFRFLKSQVWMITHMVNLPMTFPLLNLMDIFQSSLISGIWQSLSFLSPEKSLHLASRTLHLLFFSCIMGDLFLSPLVRLPPPSSAWSCNTGIPHGSVLGSLLYLIYINFLSDLI